MFSSFRVTLVRVILLGAFLGAGGCSPASEKGSADSLAPQADTSESTGGIEGRVLDPPALAPAFAPNLEVGAEGILLSWLEKGEPEYGSSNHRLQFSTLEGGAWRTPVTIAEGSNFFANWADFPKVTESAEGTLFAHWLAKTADNTYAYSVNLARSEDGGASWSLMGTLNDDSTPTEHGFVSYVKEREGVRAFWLDGRGMVDEGGSMALRTAYVNEVVEPSEILDDRVCDCCSTDAALVAGLPVVVYRDRSQDEIRDIAIIRAAASDANSKDATPKQWSESTPVFSDGWEIAGCPVNGPEMAADGDLTAVAWFTGSRDQPQVAVTFSTKSSADFETPVVIDSAGPLGRVGVVMDGANGAVVSWLAAGEDKAEIRLQRVSVDGRVGPPFVVARTDASRAAGVPRMVRSGQLLYVAWVETGSDSSDSKSQIRVREIEISSLSLDDLSTS